MVIEKPCLWWFDWEPQVGRETEYNCPSQMWTGFFVTIITNSQKRFILDVWIRSVGYLFTKFHHHISSNITYVMHGQTYVTLHLKYLLNKKNYNTCFLTLCFYRLCPNKSCSVKKWTKSFPTPLLAVRSPQISYDYNMIEPQLLLCVLICGYKFHADVFYLRSTFI